MRVFFFVGEDVALMSRAEKKRKHSIKGNCGTAFLIGNPLTTQGAKHSSTIPAEENDSKELEPSLNQSTKSRGWDAKRTSGVYIHERGRRM